MAPLLHIPTRDAKDADHLAIMLLVGGLIGIFQKDIADSHQVVWYSMSVISLISAPLIWLRVPHAKWGGVLAALLLGYTHFLAIPEGAFFSTRASFHLVGSLIVAYWYLAINYDHKYSD